MKPNSNNKQKNAKKNPLEKFIKIGNDENVNLENVQSRNNM